MNPNALQTTAGIVAMAVCNTQLNLNDRVETWNDISTEFVSYFRPRLCSAGKLALRGVQMNSYPMNMSELADFKPMNASAGGGTTTLNGNNLDAKGWAPIVINNKNGVALDLLISIEWRVRFDIGNPAVASHQHHGVTPDRTWDRMIADAISMGNGVLDIVERVASAGQAAYQIGNRARPMLALTG
jgi:hypothetical protein